MKALKHFISILTLGLLLTSCVQKQHMKTVTFKVDMNAIEKVGQVGLRGEFINSSWKQTIVLTDLDKDGIYEVTLSQETAQNTAEFKFTHNGTYELKGENNRKLNLEYKPEKLVYEAVFNNPKGNQTLN